MYISQVILYRHEKNSSNFEQLLPLLFLFLECVLCNIHASQSTFLLAHIEFPTTFLLVHIMYVLKMEK